MYKKEGIKDSLFYKTYEIDISGKEQEVEKEFKLKYSDKYIFKGFIDRVFKDIDTGEIIIEDIR